MLAHVKLCVSGVTSLACARMAAEAGADSIGVEVSSSSPRFTSAAERATWWADWPAGVAKVAVVRNPGFGDLDGALLQEFDGVLVYFANEIPFFEVAMWTDVIPPEKLWLAPQVLPGGVVDLAFLPLADRMVLDRYRPNSMALEAKTGNWPEFARLQSMHRKVEWILAGGLEPENLAEALATAEATHVLLSGASIERERGVLDPVKIEALARAAVAARAA